MSIWLKNTVQGTFDGLLIYVQTSEPDREFSVPEHNVMGRVGGVSEPMGAKSRGIPMVCVFAEAYFEAHKIFTNLLDLCVNVVKPGVLIHPVYGQQPVFPIRYKVRINAEEKVAFVDVTFRRQDLTADVLIPTGPISVSLFQVPVVAADLSGYLLSLAAVNLLRSQWLTAALAMIRLAGAIPKLAVDSVLSAGEAFSAFVAGVAEQWADSAFALQEFNTEALRRAWDVSDAVTERLITERRVDPLILAGVRNGDGTYDPGLSLTGAPLSPDQPKPDYRFHGHLVALAAWDATMAGVFANKLIGRIQEANRAQTLDAADLDAAVTLCRRRLNQALRETTTALGLQGARTARELSTVGASLLRLVETVRMRRRPLTRVITIEASQPLVLLATELLGTASRAGEIRDLNPHVTGDWNRVPRGTEIRVPVQ